MIKVSECLEIRDSIRKTKTCLSSIPFGLHCTQSAALFSRRITRVGTHSVFSWFQTYLQARKNIYIHKRKHQINSTQRRCYAMLQDDHSRISIMRYSNNFVWLCTPVYTRNNLIMLWDKRNRMKKIVSQNPLNEVENKYINWLYQNCIHKNKLGNAKYMPNLRE